MNNTDSFDKMPEMDYETIRYLMGQDHYKRTRFTPPKSLKRNKRKSAKLARKISRRNRK